MGLTPTVVDGNPIQSAWGNEIRDRTTQVFANAAERDAQWTNPPDGAFAVTLDNGLTTQRMSGAWYPTAGLIRQSSLRKPAMPVTVGTTAPAAPPGIAGFWSVAADGTVTFLRDGMYTACLAAHRTTTGVAFYVSQLWTLSGTLQPQVRMTAQTLSGAGLFCNTNWTQYALNGDKCRFAVTNNEASGTMNLIVTSSLAYMGATPGPVDT